METDIEYNLSVAIFNDPKWIVLTTISQPTEDVKKLAAIDGWKVVVVGDNKTPLNWSYPGIVFLDVNLQKQMGYKIAKHLPVNSYTRKMIGYLFAIQNGAKYIYDTDDDNHPSEGKIDFHLEPTMSGLIYDDLSQPVVNPLAHFGQMQLWPRGYPLELIAIKPNNSYQLCTFKTPAIQQGLVNGDPDVDAIYRLINKGSAKDKSINITFDAHAPPMTLPSGVFAPFNSQNTLFHYNAFWALFLPTTVDFRVTDIWRGYWAQKLLWLIGQTLSFFPPNAVQFRNPHSYLKDFAEEIQIYKDTEKLIQFLSLWNCSTNSTFFQCATDLANEFSENHFWKAQDSFLVKLWIEDLISIGYKQPIIEKMPFHKMCINNEDARWVHYSPPITQPNMGFRDLFELCEIELENITDLQKNFSLYLDPRAPQVPSYTFDNILLVIVFNFPHLKNIRMLEVLHRDHFPNIIICSETKAYSDYLKQSRSSQWPSRINDISFLNITSNGGWFGYECAIRAIEMNYKVDGYIILADDVMIKSWKLLPFDFGRSRIQNDVYKAYDILDRSINASSPWMWWETDVGRPAVENMLNELLHVSANASDSRAELFQQYLDNRHSNNFNLTIFPYTNSDFYYIAKMDAKMFLEVGKVFLKYKVFLEISVATIFSGCRKDDTLIDNGFYGISLWGGSRMEPMKEFIQNRTYLHPLKIKELLPGSDLTRTFCSDFVLESLENW